MKISPLSKRLTSYLKRHNLSKKFDKQSELFKKNPKHPSLNVELLEPKGHGIYSFRLDRKYRVLFIYRDDTDVIEIIALTSHYR